MLNCNSKTSAVIPVQKMKYIVWDMINADEWFNQMVVKDSTLKDSNIHLEKYQQIFTIHKITEQEYYESFKYYQANPAEMKQLMDSVEAYGTKVKDSLNNNIPKKIYE